MHAIYYIRSAIIFLILALFIIKVPAQGVYISSGASLVMNDKVHMVLNNAGFTNNGKFTPGKSTVWFTGYPNAGPSVVGGSSSFSFNRAIIRKRKSTVLLRQSISISDTLFMQGGNFVLDKNTLTLGLSGGILGESDSSYITSDSNTFIVTIKIVNSPPVAYNPGNIGVEITSAVSPGTLIAIRRFAQITLPNGSKSIKRVYVLSATTVPPLNAKLRFHYLDHELDSNNESLLNVWGIDSTNKWVLLGRDSIDVFNNVVTLQGIDHLRSYTLNDGVSNQRTIVSSPASKQGSILVDTYGNDKMQVYPVPAHDYCIQMITSDRSRKSEIYLFDEWGRILQHKKIFLLAGANSISWNLSGYPAGVYFLTTDNLKANKVKIIKQ